jgi:hypothetical protein
MEYSNRLFVFIEKDNSQMKYLISLIVLLFCVHTQAQSLVCGLKPLPKVGCKIGQCIDGKWQQVCSNKNPYSNNNSPFGNQQATNLSCGIKPIPPVGCKIGQCIDGKWQKVCR